MAGQSSENHPKRMFLLCNAWVAGLISNEEFCTRSHVESNEAMQARPPPTGGDAQFPHLTREFKHALRCVLSVHQAIDDLQEYGVAGEPPIAARGYYFGRELNEESIRAMRLCLAPRDLS